MDDSLKVGGESWYGLDQYLIHEGDGGWWKADYQIMVGFQQENDAYNEALGHTREFFDFCIPEKILLLWTDDMAQTVERVNEAVRRASESKMPNVGNLHILIGDRPKVNEFLRNQTRPTDCFQTVSVKADVELPCRTTC